MNQIFSKIEQVLCKWVKTTFSIPLNVDQFKNNLDGAMECSY